MTKTKTEQTKKQTLTGRIVNLAVGQDTIKVEVETRYRHPMYERLLKQHKTFLVHLAEEQKSSYQLGQEVTIVSTRPLSARKSWKLVITKSRTKKKQ